jgi:hypothetical protein
MAQSTPAALLPETPSETRIETLDKKLEDEERGFTPTTSCEKVNGERNAAPVADGEKSPSEDSLEFEVWWDEIPGQETKDPKNPINWAEKKKWSNIAVLSSITFLTSGALNLLPYVADRTPVR